MREQLLGENLAFLSEAARGCIELELDAVLMIKMNWAEFRGADPTPDDPLM
jgi:hypothetical protein